MGGHESVSKRHQLRVPFPYENDVPVTCRWTILDLLHARRGDGTIRTLHAGIHAWLPAHVEVWEEDGDHGRGEGTTRRYRVDRPTVDAMLAEGLLRHTPRWGGVEKYELLISVLGEGALEQKWEARTSTATTTTACPPASLWLRRR
jgi:hypothetical protein